MTVEGLQVHGEKISKSKLFKDFAKQFQKDEPKFGLLNFEYQEWTANHSRIVFVYYQPKDLDLKQKNDFDNAFDAVVKHCEPIYKLIKILDFSQMNLENF